MPSISSPSFARLVAALKQRNKTCTVIESSCGGLINASILAQPGASEVYYGGSVAYNTRKAKPFLLNKDKLHDNLMAVSNASNKQAYMESKSKWTKQASLAFCQDAEVDFCIAEGGATGPTFRPDGLDTGFAVISIAARVSFQTDKSKPQYPLFHVVEQRFIESSHADREINMRYFADQAAQTLLKVVTNGMVDDIDDPATAAQQQQLQVAAATSNTSSGKPHLDRATHLRTDPDKLQQLAEQAQYVVLHKNVALFRKSNNNNDNNRSKQQLQDELHNRQLLMLSAKQIADVCQMTNAKQVTTFLGLINEHDPIFGVDLLLDNDDKNNDTTTILGDAIEKVLAKKDAMIFEDTRSVAPLLDPKTCDNELVLHATALAQWQRLYPHCPVCGSITTLTQAGTCRTCTHCGHASWPRQDPSMIAVVSNREGTKVLLGRSKRHPARMHTALAGFVEAGETMEKAVAREIYEETGIRVDEESVQYVASQPWPFPQSTMVGFTVQADESQPLNIDTNELVEAAWFDKSQVQLASSVRGPVMQKEVAEAALANNPSLPLLIPPKGVLARTLIDTWLHTVEE